MATVGKNWRTVGKHWGKNIYRKGELQKNTATNDIHGSSLYNMAFFTIATTTHGQLSGEVVIKLNCNNGTVFAQVVNFSGGRGRRSHH